MIGLTRLIGTALADMTGLNKTYDPIFEQAMTQLTTSVMVDAVEAGYRGSLDNQQPARGEP